MSKRLARQVLADKATVHPTVAAHQPTTVDRSFELPTRLYVAFAGLFFAAIGVMTIGFAAPRMILPTAIFLIFLAMFFAVPAQWVRMKPENPQRAATWAHFRKHGIMTPFGRCSANAATIQMLILPLLILLWGITTVAIAAVLR